MTNSRNRRKIWHPPATATAWQRDIKSLTLQKKNMASTSHCNRMAKRYQKFDTYTLLQHFAVKTLT